MRRLVNGSRFARLGTRRRLLRNVNASPFGAELGGLLRRHSWSRFAATAVLWPVPAGYSVLVIASVFDCDCTLSRAGHVVKPLDAGSGKIVNGFTP
jgi:hypothetical protein